MVELLLETLILCNVLEFSSASVMALFVYSLSLSFWPLFLSASRNLQGVYCVPNSAAKLGYTTGTNLCLKSCNTNNDCEKFFFYIQGTECVSDPSVSYKFCYFSDLLPLSDTTVSGSSGGGGSVGSFDLGGPYQLNPSQVVWLPPIAITVSGLAPGETTLAQLTQGASNAFIAVNFDQDWSYIQGDSVQVKFD